MTNNTQPNTIKHNKNTTTSLTNTTKHNKLTTKHYHRRVDEIKLPADGEGGGY
jgi:hypothetical protein